MVFLDLALESNCKVLDRLPQLIHDHFVLALELQIKQFENVDYHPFVIFLNYFKVFMWLEYFDDTFKTNQWVELEYGTVKDFFSLSVDEEFIVLLVKNKTQGFLLLSAIALLVFHAVRLFIKVLLYSINLYCQI